MFNKFLLLDVGVYTMGKLFDFKNKSENKKFEFKMSSESMAEILIYDQIGESYWEETVSGKQFVQDLNDLPSSVSEIQLRVNSPGGSVFDGLLIYEALKRHKAKVVAHIDGLAASIASIIIMAADEVIMGEGAMVMIHKPMSGVYGNADEMEKMINTLDKIEDQMIGIYARRTGKSRPELARLLSAETWFTSDEAIAGGFADSKTEDSDALYLAASMLKDAPFRNKPKMKSENYLIKKKIAEMKNNVEGFLARDKA